MKNRKEKVKGDNMDRSFILKRIPEISWIQNEGLLNQCLDTWLYAAEFAKVTDEDLDQITFANFVLKGCEINLLEHTRTVVQTAALLVDQFNKTYQNVVPANRDLVLAAAVLHDVGKVQEHCMDHKGIKFEKNEYLEHEFWGAYFAQCCSLPWQVVYIIRSHRNGRPDKKDFPESFLVYNADWLNFKYLCFGYETM